MKIKQETIGFKPITIKLETLSEAKALFDLVDKLDNYYTNEGAEFHHRDFTRQQRDLIVKLSNARTNGLFV